jgi:hypothetical protein
MLLIYAIMFKYGGIVRNIETMIISFCRKRSFVSYNVSSINLIRNKNLLSSKF